MNQKDLSLIDTKAASEFLNIKLSRIRSLVFQRKIPHLKLGATIMFEKAELIKWLQTMRKETQHG